MVKLKKPRASHTSGKAGSPSAPPKPAPLPEEATESSTRPKRKRRLQQRKGRSQAEVEADHAEVEVPQPAQETEQKLFQTNTSFAKLGLAKWIVDTCGKLGMNYPTDIQAMAIPPVLSGKNIAGNARTGSGKTACYSLPILHHLSKDPYGVFALILVPVRELAFQAAHFKKKCSPHANGQYFNMLRRITCCHQRGMPA